MDAQSALGDDLLDLVDADLAAVLELQRAPRHEAAIVNGEYQCLEDRPVFAVERTVDEDLIGVAWFRQGRLRTRVLGLRFYFFRLIACTAERAAVRDTVPVFAELLTVRALDGCPDALLRPPELPAPFEGLPPDFPLEPFGLLIRTSEVEKDKPI